MPPPESELTPQLQVKAQMRQVLINGGKFLKFGKRGDPHLRFICCNVFGNLHWDKEAMDPRKPFPSSNFIPYVCCVLCVCV